MLQQKKLDKCFQDEESVSEYVYELEELFNIIGIINDHEKVIRLWDGLNTSIQKALWRDGYNPKISSWDEVRTARKLALNPNLKQMMTIQKQLMMNPRICDFLDTKKSKVWSIPSLKGRIHILRKNLKIISILLKRAKYSSNK